MSHRDTPDNSIGHEIDSRPFSFCVEGFPQESNEREMESAGRYIVRMGLIILKFISKEKTLITRHS